MITLNKSIKSICLHKVLLTYGSKTWQSSVLQMNVAITRNKCVFIIAIVTFSIMKMLLSRYPSSYSISTKHFVVYFKSWLLIMQGCAIKAKIMLINTHTHTHIRLNTCTETTHRLRYARMIQSSDNRAASTKEMETFSAHSHIR